MIYTRTCVSRSHASATVARVKAAEIFVILGVLERVEISHANISS